MYVPKEQQIKEFENLKIKEKKKNEDQNKTKSRRISQVIVTNIINLIEDGTRCKWVNCGLKQTGEACVCMVYTREISSIGCIKFVIIITLSF